LTSGEFASPYLGARSISRFVEGRPAVALGLLVVLAIAVLFPYRHFAGDDAYITFRFARNLAEGGGFSFNAGVPTYGSTAPLWVFLISGLHLLGLDIPDAAHLMNWVFAITDVVLFFVLASRYLGRNLSAWIATLLLVADPWFVRWSLSGMENPLALALLIGMLLSQLQMRNSGRINWTAPLLAGLAGLCRPEMTLLSGLLVLDNLLLERRRLPGNLITAGIAYAAIFIPWLWYAVSVFHSPIPNTITAKVSADHLLALERVMLYFATFWVFQAIAIVCILLLKPLREQFSQHFRGSLSKWILPTAWAIILPAFYVAGGAPVAGRYMVFALPCYLLIGVAAWMIVASKFPRLIGAAFVATLGLVIFIQYKYCWYITHWPQGMDPRMIEAAQTLKRISSPADAVAADQIGVLGYYSDRTVLDTYGLASPEILPYRRDPDPAATWRYVRERGVRYLFVINTIDELSGLDPAYKSLSLVETVPVQREGANAASGPTTYFLYKTNWEQTSDAH
jgi:arabinofuranosyltransferase